MTSVIPNVFEGGDGGVFFFETLVLVETPTEVFRNVCWNIDIPHQGGVLRAVSPETGVLKFFSSSSKTWLY